MFKKIKAFLFSNASARQTVAKNTVWLSASNIGGRLLRAGLVIYAARILGTAEWGVASYALSIVALLTIFTDFGIGAVLVRETGREKEGDGRRTIIATSLGIKLALLSASALFLIFALPSLTTVGGAAALFPIVVIVLISDALRDFAASIARSIERMEREAWLQLATDISIVCFGITALAIRPTAASLAVAYAAGTAVGLAGALRILWRYLKECARNFSPPLAWKLFASAWPFAIAGLMGGVMVNTDLLMLGAFRGAEEIGLYAAAEKPVQLFYLLPIILATALFPTFSRLARTDDGRLRRVFERGVGLIFLIALPIAAGGIIVAPKLMDLLFGSAYLPAVGAFRILFATIAFNFPIVVFANALFAYNKQTVLMRAAIGGAGMNLLLDLLFIPPFGIIGSAWATLISQFAVNMYLWREMMRTNPFGFSTTLKNAAVATACMTLVAAGLAATGANLFVIVLISVLLYSGALKLLGEPLIRELKLILRPPASSARAGSE